MPDVKLTSDQAKRIVPLLLKQEGGMIAMAAGSAAKIIDGWEAKGVSLYIDSSSPLGQALIKQGVIRAPDSAGGYIG